MMLSSNTCYNSFLSIKISKKAAIISLLLLVSISCLDLSFKGDITDLRRLFGYPLFFIVNILLFWWGLQTRRQNISLAPHIFNYLMSLLLIWGGFMILRSFDIEPTRVRDLFCTHWGAMCYLLPFIAFFGLRASFWPHFCYYGIHFLKIGIVLIGIQGVLAYVGTNESLVFVSYNILYLAPLFYFSGFIVNKKYLYLGATGLLVWLFYVFFLDSRQNIVLIAWYFFCSLLMIRFISIFTFREKIRFWFIGLIISSVLIVGSHALYSNVATESLNTRVTEFFFEGGALSNSREGLTEGFFRYLTLKDIFVGKGAVSTYDVDDTRLAQASLGGKSRQLIEIGHLYHMLTGGIVQNVLFSSVALSAIFLGLRRSLNLFTYFLALIIMGWYLMMFTAAIPYGDLRYFLVWLAIGGCWSKELRGMTTNQFVNLWHNHALKTS